MGDSITELSAQSEILEWLTLARCNDDSWTQAVPPSQLERWRLDEASGSIAHESGGFFRISGVAVKSSEGWPSRPLIFQNGVGLLGLVLRPSPRGVQALIQAKMEPGNSPRVQLAPTVQATPSNLSGAHGGGKVPLASWVLQLSDDSRHVLQDLELGEQPDYFFRKANRHVIVLATHGPDPDLIGDAGSSFAWCLLEHLMPLAAQSMTLNADLRSLLAVLGPYGSIRESSRQGASAREFLASHGSPTDRSSDVVRRVRLQSVPGWSGWAEIDAGASLTWALQGIRVQTSTRESASWDQPLVAPRVNPARLLHYDSSTRCVGVLKRVNALSLHGWEWVPCLRDPLGPSHGLSTAVLHEEEGGRFVKSETEHAIEVVGDGSLKEPQSPQSLEWLPPALVARHPNSSMELRSAIATLYGLAGV